MSLAKLTELVSKTDNKTTLTIQVSSRGGMRMELTREKKGSTLPVPLVIPMSTNVTINTIDELASDFIIDLAAQQLGLKDRW
jgi:hypothetical protein